MQNNIWIILGIVGALIIFALAIYAGKLLMQVRQQESKKHAAQEAHQAQMYINDVNIYNSVIIIVRAMKEEQCDISEGCWRISVLLDSLQTQETLEQDFPAIFELYRGIKHLAILDDRKALSKQVRMKQDVDRLKLEAQLGDRIKDDLVNLHTFAAQQQIALSPS